LAKFRYLHFATHGEANNVSLFASKLILSQDQAPTIAAVVPIGEPLLDNEMTAGEVLDHWKLDADLVTLSACETALGREAGGDGMLGFAQAFLLAGSRSVCLSLWKVDDTATALLMDRFYRNLLGKREDGAMPMGKAAALHEAKTWLKSLTLAEATDRLGVITEGVSRGSKKGREVIGETPTSADSPRDAMPYAHPKYWAAFILIGDPD
jgi:CHAT domain-containing protein